MGARPPLLGKNSKMVWANSNAYDGNLRERRFPFGNKSSLLVLLAFLVVACSDDKKSKQSSGSEETPNEGPVKKLVPKKRSGSEPANESTPNGAGSARPRNRSESICDLQDFWSCLMLV
jgi:hypothetical protein